MEFLALNPLPYTLGEAVDIHNEAITGAFFVPAGVGNIREHLVLVVRWNICLV